MPALARYAKHGNVGVITLDNPPVNGLSRALRAEILRCLDLALADDEVHALVIHGAGRCFSGGANIRELGKPEALIDPDPREVIAAIEDADKPVVAAIHGVALGGGAELALGCHHRIGSRDAQLGFPEVGLRLLPGAGGTQRLPRVVGVARALDMIVSGRPIGGEQAVQAGLLDRMTEGDVLDAAVSFARRIAGEKLPPRRTRSAAVPLVDAEAAIAAARERAAQAARSNPALSKCIDCIEAAATQPFEAGLRFERERFLQLLQTTESKALRHAFLAERAAAKVPGIPEETPRRAIDRAAVIGAGTMGTGIAMAFAAAGIPVFLLDVQEASLDRGLAAIHDRYAGMVAKGRLTEAESSGQLSLIRPVLDYEDIGTDDIVVEAVFEDMAVKRQVFAELDRTMKRDAILATNTSTLDVDAIADATSRPGAVIGTHFFSPAHVMRLLEIVRGGRTEPWVVASTLALAKRMGKIGVVAGVCDGFIGNRMIEEYLRQAYFLLEEGALPQQVDRALQRWGMAMGPFAMMDLAGNDVGQLIRSRRVTADPARQIYSRIPDLVCDLGRYGQKTGAGFYRYPDGSRTPVPDPLVERLVVEHSRDIGMSRRAITDEEIVARCVFALVNEGARILEEGIALRASDIDVVYLAGYGFPRHRGGPMFYADTVGLDRVLETIESLRAATRREALRQYWEPAALLARLAHQGKTFSGE